MLFVKKLQVALAEVLEFSPWVRLVGVILLCLFATAGLLFVYLVGIPFAEKFLIAFGKTRDISIDNPSVHWTVLILIRFAMLIPTLIIITGSVVLHFLLLIASFTVVMHMYNNLVELVSIGTYHVRSWWQWLPIRFAHATEQEYSVKQYGLGNAYWKHENISDRKALRCWRKAAAHGHVEAQAMLAAAHNSCTGYFDKFDAYVWSFIAKESGNEKFVGFFAKMHERIYSGHRSSSVKKYGVEKSADLYTEMISRMNPGQYYPGHRYLPKRLSKSQAICAQKIAVRRLVDMKRRDVNSKPPAYALGLAYWHGQSVIADKHMAVRWFHEAAEQGDTDAQEYLRVAYLYGVGAIQNDREGYIWARLVARGDVYMPHKLFHYRFIYMGERSEFFASKYKIDSAEKEATQRRERIGYCEVGRE